MLLGSVQISGERISRVEVDDICKALQADRVRLLALRECRTEDEHFQKLMKSTGCCRSILHLNLNLGLLSSSKRAKMLKDCLVKNRSLNALFIHGSPLGDRGARHVLKGVILHPNIESLDVGECQLTDMSIPLITSLLPRNGAKKGLKELTLSANQSITSKGWTELFMALPSSCSLQTLNIDYNNIGDYGAGCLAVALASNHTLENIDLEACGIEEFGAKVLLSLIKNHPVSIKCLILAGNRIKASTIEEINVRLEDTQRHNTPEHTSENSCDEVSSQSGSWSSARVPLDESKAHNSRNVNVLIRNRMGSVTRTTVERLQATSHLAAAPQSKVDVDYLSNSDDVQTADDMELLCTGRDPHRRGSDSYSEAYSKHENSSLRNVSRSVFTGAASPKSTGKKMTFKQKAK